MPTKQPYTLLWHRYLLLTFPLLIKLLFNLAFIDIYDILPGNKLLHGLAGRERHLANKIQLQVWLRFKRTQQWNQNMQESRQKL